jgi:hypothetical protein
MASSIQALLFCGYGGAGADIEQYRPFKRLVGTPSDSKIIFREVAQSKFPFEEK